KSGGPTGPIHGDGCHLVGQVGQDGSMLLLEHDDRNAARSAYCRLGRRRRLRRRQGNQSTKPMVLKERSHPVDAGWLGPRRATSITGPPIAMPNMRMSAISP